MSDFSCAKPRRNSTSLELVKEVIANSEGMKIGRCEEAARWNAEMLDLAHYVRSDWAHLDLATVIENRAKKMMEGVE